MSQNSLSWVYIKGGSNRILYGCTRNSNNRRMPCFCCKATTLRIDARKKFSRKQHLSNSMHAMILLQSHDSQSRYIQACSSSKEGIARITTSFCSVKRDSVESARITQNRRDHDTFLQSKAQFCSPALPPPRLKSIQQL